MAKRIQPTAEELRGRLNVTVVEAQILTGFARKRIFDLMDTDQWRWFWEGNRRRIVTDSIVDYQNSKADKAAGL